MTWVASCQVDPSANGGTCPVEQRAWVELPDQAIYSPFNLDVAGAVQIGVAILSVWAVGWAFAMLARVINESDGG
jgi:hypothetical protein